MTGNQLKYGKITKGTISRYCDKRDIDDEGLPTRGAYELTPKDISSAEKNDQPVHLSFNYLDYHKGTREDQIAKIRDIISQKLTLHKKDKLCLLEIKTIEEEFCLPDDKYPEGCGHLVNIISIPDVTDMWDDQSHCGFVVEDIDQDVEIIALRLMMASIRTDNVISAKPDQA